MNADELVCPPFSAEEAALIKSTRIRVGRNLKAFPLGPGVSNEQRDEIMAQVVAACNEFTGDLEGQLYALDGMDQEVQKQLV